MVSSVSSSAEDVPSVVSGVSAGFPDVSSAGASVPAPAAASGFF